MLVVVFWTWTGDREGKQRDPEGNIPGSNSDNQVHHHQQDALKPVRFAVPNEVVDQKNRDKE